MPTTLPLTRKPATRGEYDDMRLAKGHIEIVDMISEGVARVLVWLRERRS